MKPLVAPTLKSMLFLLLLVTLAVIGVNFWAGRRLVSQPDSKRREFIRNFISNLTALTGVHENQIHSPLQEFSDPLSRARYGSRSFYLSQAAALSPRGIFMQSLPLERFSRVSARLVLNNIAAGFPYLRVFRIGEDLMLCASLHPLQLIREHALKGDSAEEVLAREEWLPRQGFYDTYGETWNKITLFYWGLRDAFDHNRTTTDQILATPDEWRWSLIYSKKTLLATYVGQSVDKFKLQKIIRSSCPTGRVDLIEPNWRYLRTPCRDALVAAIAADSSNTPQNLQREFAWLRDFINPGTASSLPNSQDSLQEVLDRIYWFAQLDSIFLPLSPKRLIWQSSKCYTAPSPEYFFCRAELVRTLSYTGYFKEAERELEALEKEGGMRLHEKMLSDLKSYLAAARHVG